MTKRVAALFVFFAALAMAVALVVRLPKPELTLAFTREELQQRVAAKFPLDQKLPLVTMTYSEPVVKLQEGSDRIGLELVSTATFAGNQIAKGRVAGDWKIRYEPKEGALYFDDPQIAKLDIDGLPPPVQSTVRQVATPLIKDYLRRVPVHRLKPGDMREDLAKGVLKSVRIQNAKLIVVVGPG